MAKARILREGETNINSTDIWRFILHEGYPTQKVHSAGSGSVIIPSSGSPEQRSITVTHNIGYIPKCKVSILPSGGYLERISGANDFFIGFDQGYYAYIATTTKLVIDIGFYLPIASSKSFTAYYIILNDD